MTSGQPDWLVAGSSDVVIIDTTYANTADAGLDYIIVNLNTAPESHAVLVEVDLSGFPAQVSGTQSVRVQLFAGPDYNGLPLYDTGQLSIPTIPAGGSEPLVSGVVLPASAITAGLCIGFTGVNGGNGGTFYTPVRVVGYVATIPESNVSLLLQQALTNLTSAGVRTYGTPPQPLLLGSNVGLSIADLLQPTTELEDLVSGAVVGYTMLTNFGYAVLIDRVTAINTGTLYDIIELSIGQGTAIHSKRSIQPSGAIGDSVTWEFSRGLYLDSVSQLQFYQNQAQVYDISIEYRPYFSLT